MDAFTAFAIIGGVYALLLIISKIMDIIAGFLGALAGIALYVWLDTQSGWAVMKELIIGFNMNSSEIKKYLVIFIAFNIIVFIVGVTRCKKNSKDELQEKNKELTENKNKKKPKKKKAENNFRRKDRKTNKEETGLVLVKTRKNIIRSNIIRRNKYKRRNARRIDNGITRTRRDELRRANNRKNNIRRDELKERKNFQKNY